MRRADARSAKIDRCCGVIRSFQVSLYKVEPSKAVLARNLLSKEERRAALRDEAEQFGPEVSVIFGSLAASSRAEGLARGAPSPDQVIVGDASAAQSVAPHTDAGKEVALRESFKVT